MFVAAAAIGAVVLLATKRLECAREEGSREPRSLQEVAFVLVSSIADECLSRVRNISTAILSHLRGAGAAGGARGGGGTGGVAGSTDRGESDLRAPYRRRPREERNLEEHLRNTQWFGSDSQVPASSPRVDEARRTTRDVSVDPLRGVTFNEEPFRFKVKERVILIQSNDPRDRHCSVFTQNLKSFIKDRSIADQDKLETLDFFQYLVAVDSRKIFLAPGVPLPEIWAHVDPYFARLVAKFPEDRVYRVSYRRN